MKNIGATSYNEVVVWGLDKISFNYTDTSGSALTFEELDKKLKEEMLQEDEFNVDEEVETGEMNFDA